MAETASSSVGTEGENSAVTTNSLARIVAPPKFVFGQNMADRIKPLQDDDAGSSSDEESVNFVGVKRPVHNEEKKNSESEEGCLSPVKKVAKLESTEKDKDEPDEVKPAKLLFKPSTLSEVAKNLACSSNKVERNSMTSPIPKTLGVSSSESQASEQSTDSSLRSHESASGEVGGATAPAAENYFQQFLTGKVQSSAQSSSGSFVFGQNMGERVMFSSENNEKENELDDKSEQKPTDDSSRECQLSSPVFAEKEPKTLAEVAQSCAVSQGPTSPTQERPHKSLAEAAMAYQEHCSPPKTQPARVAIVTGEEEERNVLQCNCRLFVFDTVTHSWRERGRGVLRLNDMCQSMSEGIFQSRLVMRTQGSLRVVLNTKLWPSMTLEKGNEKSLRITAMDSEKDIKIYLVMSAPNDIQRLWTAIDRRIQALKRGQECRDAQEAGDHDYTADSKEEGNTLTHGTLSHGTSNEAKADDGDDSAKGPCRTPDESSNDSYPTGDDSPSYLSETAKKTAPDDD